MVRSKYRDELQAFLRNKGIVALIHYPVPIHLQPAYEGRISCDNTLSETETASKEILSLPMYPELTDSDVMTVADAIREFNNKGF